jgi:hypothetical protein
MNVKRIFGVLLTILGIAGLIYAAMIALNTGGRLWDLKALAIYGLLGLVFFISGISLVRTTHDDNGT